MSGQLKANISDACDVWVDHLRVHVQRTDEGVVVDVFSGDDVVASTYAHFNEVGVNAVPTSKKLAMYQNKDGDIRMKYVSGEGEARYFFENCIRRDGAQKFNLDDIFEAEDKFCCALDVWEVDEDGEFTIGTW